MSSVERRASSQSQSVAPGCQRQSKSKSKSEIRVGASEGGERGTFGGHGMMAAPGQVRP